VRKIAAVGLPEGQRVFYGHFLTLIKYDLKQENEFRKRLFEFQDWPASGYRIFARTVL